LSDMRGSSLAGQLHLPQARDSSEKRCALHGFDVIRGVFAEMRAAQRIQRRAARWSSPSAMTRRFTETTSRPKSEKPTKQCPKRRGKITSRFKCTGFGLRDSLRRAFYADDRLSTQAREHFSQQAQIAQDLRSAFMKWEESSASNQAIKNNRRHFADTNVAESHLEGVPGSDGKYTVRVQVLTPVGVLDRDKNSWVWCENCILSPRCE